jgi:hypothetical protein
VVPLHQLQEHVDLGQDPLGVHGATVLSEGGVPGGRQLLSDESGPGTRGDSKPRGSRQQGVLGRFLALSRHVQGNGPQKVQAARGIVALAWKGILQGA